MDLEGKEKAQVHFQPFCFRLQPGGRFYFHFLRLTLQES